MNTNKLAKKLLAFVLSVLLVAAVFPLAAAADNEFVSVNVLTGENSLVDFENSTPVYHDKYLTTNANVTYGENAIASGYGLDDSTITGLVDGNLDNECLFNGRGATSRWWNGVRYALTESCFASKITIYSGLAAYIDRYDVYASDSLSTLYTADNFLGEFTCTGSAVDVPVNRNVQYFALIYNQISSENESARPREIQLWTGDEANTFAPVCLTNPDSQKLTDYKSLAINPTTMATSTLNVNSNYLDDYLVNTTNTTHDVNPNSNRAAFQFAFDDLYYIGDVVIDAGTWNCDETWDVYASTSAETLYSEQSKVATLNCQYAIGNRATLNTYATYVAFVQTTGYARIRAFRIYTANSAGTSAPFVPENVLLDTSKRTATPIYQNISTGEVTEDTSYYFAVEESRFIAYTDGDIGTHKDMRGFTINAQRVGAMYALLESTYIGNIVLYASIGESYPESYSIYASNSLENLLSDESRLVNCQSTSGAAITATVNEYIRYIAFFCESYTGNPRFREIEAWTAQVPEDYEPPFAPENVLRTSLGSAVSKAQYVSSGNINTEAVISSDLIPYFTDGDCEAHKDLPTSLDWGDSSRKAGVEFALTDTFYIGEIRLYAGFENAPESYTVYASDSLDTLYSAENKLANSVTAAGTAVVVTANKNVQYIAFFCESYTGNPRFKEIEAWTAEAPEVFVSENVLHTALASATSKAQYLSSGNINTEAVISSDLIPYFTDEDCVTHKDLPTSLDWEDSPRKAGVEFALTDTFYIGEIRLYAGFENASESYTVYASDSLDTLYNAGNKVADAVTATGEVVVEVNKNVQYIAFFCESYTGNPRFKEIEAWTAQPGPEPEEPSFPQPINDGVTRVLTIGNSFAENASGYASEIAKVNGQRLMFGYLKYPSCTLAQHLTAAQNDTAMFRFRVTDENGSGTTVSESYTIYQALSYTYWDVIVFQQESSNARYYNTFSPYLDGLIEYVKEYYPDAKLMFHQVWRWGSWEEDQFDLIQAASENAAADYGLPLIPSGLAFEYARAEIGNPIAINEYDDGKYQHANDYGKFLAGCCYVGAIFDIAIDEDTFANHTYINDNTNQYASTLVEAANKALMHYGGDLDGDFEISANDLVLIRKSILGTTDLTNAVLDVNRDGNVDVRDFIRLSKAILATADAVADLYTLRVEGNSLMLNDTAVSLQGVNLPQLSWSSYGDGSTVKGQSNADTAFETALDWDSGIIRLAVDPDLYMNGGTGNGGGQTTTRSRVAYRNQIDGYIEEATSLGIPVILDCHAYGGVTADILEFWETAAARYDDNDLVMYGLLNEPITGSSSDWTTWFEGGTAYIPELDGNGNISYTPVSCVGFPTLISQIRAVSDNVLVVGGTNWAGNLSGFISGDYAQTFAALAQTGNGIVLDIHVYQTKYSENIKNQIIAAAAQYPVVLGEYGPDAREGVLNELYDDETAFLNSIFDLIEENGLSSTAWSLGAHPYLTDAAGNVTAFGQQVRTFLASAQ